MVPAGRDDRAKAVRTRRDSAETLRTARGWRRASSNEKAEIAKGLADEAGLTEAEAADRLDGVVHDIVTKLRKGRPAAFPGLGRFTRGRDGTVSFRREGHRGRG